MTRRITLLFLVGLLINTSFLQAEDAPARPADFGKQWVRSHPFTITATVLVGNTFDIQTYTGAGLNTVMLWENEEGVIQQASQAGVPWILHSENRRNPAEDGFMESTQIERDRAARYAQTYPGCAAFILWDEVKGANLDHARSGIDWARQNFPQILSYINVHAMEPGADYWIRVDEDKNAPPSPKPYEYPDFLKDVVARTGTDVLSVDPYPYVDPEEYPFYGDVPKLLNTKYYYTLGTARKVAMDAGMPYWLFAQTMSIPSAYYLPSESDLRMQVFTTLAYGFTGIQYFIYQAPDWRGILETSGKPGELYSQISDLNQEVAHLGKPLRFLTSTDVRFIPGKKGGKTNVIPDGISSFDRNAGDRVGIAGIQVLEEGEFNNGLIGTFTDDNGGKYFMLVNVKREKDKSADEMKQSFKINFISPVPKEIHRLNRDTGVVEAVPLKGNSLQIELPGGTGDLFKMGDADFPLE